MANVMKLNDIVHGDYGREIAYTNAEEVDESNILEVLQETLPAYNKNKPVVEYLWNYYKGDQPALYRTKVTNEDINNRVVVNRAYEIVQFKTGQTFGEPLQYISRTDNEEKNVAVDILSDYMEDAGKHLKDIAGGEWQSATGTSYKAIQNTGNKSKPFRIVVPTPLNTYVAYCRLTEEAVVAVQVLQNSLKRVLLCFTKTKTIRVEDGRITDVRLHAYGDIPIVEVPNNAERISDIELVATLLDNINEIESNRVDGIAQFVQSWVKFVNCDIDTESFREMKKEHALSVNSSSKDIKADVGIMTQELDQTQTQVAVDDLWDSALGILAIPTKQSNTGGDTAGAVELRNGWDFSKTRAKMKDPIVKAAEKRLACIALNVLRVEGDIELDLTEKDFYVQINHSPQDNMYTKAQTLTVLLQAGIHPLIAIRTVGLWGDSEKTYLLSKPYLDALYTKIEDAEGQEKKAKEIIEKLKKV